MGYNGRRRDNARLDGPGKDRVGPQRGMHRKSRPIACLNTSYKLLTGVLAGMLWEHVFDLEILPTEQKALPQRDKKVFGCPDGRHGNIGRSKEGQMQPIGSVGGLPEGLRSSPTPVGECNDEASKCSETHQGPDEKARMWATDLCLWTAEGPEHIHMMMKRGIFQGDSLFPLLFCLCVAPLSEALRETG